MQRLINLLKEENTSQNRGKWKYMLGNIPVHYKRITLDEKRADKLAKYGAAELFSGYDIKTYYTQGLIAGCMMSGEFDTVVVVTPSQYGKSWLLGHITPLMAFKGKKISIAAATKDGTEIIMTYTRQALTEAHEDIKHALTNDAVRKVDRLDQSLSKTRISYAEGGGYLESITLGDTYTDLAHNKAIGRGTGYVIDEAANVSDDAINEVGRRELSSIDGSKELLVMISNPHKPGAFYDALTEENPSDRTAIIWMDALTAVQEGRWTAEHVLTSEFAKHQDTRTRYWMCELPGSGAGMFPDPVVKKEHDKGLHFLGIDAAYKGKDNIEVADVIVCPDGSVHVNDIATIKKDNWIDGVTSKDVIKAVSVMFKGIDAAMACIDIGFGVWLLEGLLSNGCDCRGVSFGAGPSRDRIKARHYAATQASNMRAEMHLDLQSLMEDQKITWSPQTVDMVKDILPFVTYERKSSGKIQIRPKIEIKNIIGHSPDKLDAVLLAVHAAILYTSGQV